MNGDSVKEIKQMVKEALIVEVDGKKYSAATLKPVLEDSMQVLKVCSLTAFSDFLLSDHAKKTFDFSKAFVVVNGPQRVEVVTNINECSQKRDIPLVAEIISNFESFYFGHYHSQEEFLIKLKSLFEATSDVERLTSFVNKITDKSEVAYEDDGVTQVVEVKKGLSGAVKSNEAAPSIVTLSPYRTFREISPQPSSQFLFRLTAGRQGPSCALFEADGGAWMHDAMKKVGEYLKEKLAETGLKVFY